MSEWFYLSLGFAILFVLQRGERPKKPGQIWKFSIGLSGAFILLIALDAVFSRFFWTLLARPDLRLISFLLFAFLIDRGKGGPFFWVLMAFALWTIGKEGSFSVTKSFLAGLGLIGGAGLFEMLLEGLRERLKLSNLPPALEGPTLIFWLASLIFLSFWGFHSLPLPFVN